MNLLEHYIKKIISEEDCTDDYERSIGRKPRFPCIKVVAEINCYGIEETVTNYWLQPDWEEAKKRGYYIA